MDSTIDLGHSLQQEVRDYDARLTELTRKEAPLPQSIISDRSSLSRSNKPEDQACKLPKIELPHFHGNIMEWNEFWVQFKQSVDDNKKVSKANKLAYLRDVIRDPDTRTLLSCGSESAGYYDEMIDVLHQRFDQTRVIHAAYCRKLADIAPVKHNKASSLISFTPPWQA